MNSREFAVFMGTLAKALPRFAPDIGDQEVVSIWFKELGGLTTAEASDVYRAAVRRYDSFPSIRQILELAGQTEQSDEDKGREVGERIWSAIAKYGSFASNWPKVQAYIGPIGEEVVRMQGGWNTICDTADYDNAGQLKAQWRELATVLARKERSRHLDTPPDFSKLPEKARAQLKALGEKWDLTTKRNDA